MKANEIIGEGVLGGIGKVLQKVGGKMVDRSAASAEKAAAKAAEKAAAKAAAEPGILSKTANAVTWPIRNPVKAGALGVAGATIQNKLADPSISWGKAVGQGARDVGNFLGDIYSGATGDESPMKTVQRQVDALPDPDNPDNPDLEAPGVQDDGDYVSKIRQRSAERFDDWPSQQNEDIKKKFAITEKEKTEKEDPLAAIQRGIFGQESGYGKAKTDKPNYAGAVGQMQIMPGTFDWIKKLKLIPQDYDIKNPKHNREAGNALIAHYYKKYDGDTAKVAAAYYGGPGAINKDGTINTHWRDKKNPKAPTVGQYIDQTLAKANLPASAATTALAGVPRGSGAKPSEPITKAKIQKPHYIPTGPSPEETLAQTDRELAVRRDAVQRIPTGPESDGVSSKADKSPEQKKNAAQQRISTGPGPEETLAQTDRELAARRAAAGAQKNNAIPIPVPAQTTGDPFRSPEPSTKPEEKPSTPIASNDTSKGDSGWDKFINTVTVGRVPPEEKERIRIPEAINKELQDILRLAGKR